MPTYKVAKVKTFKGREGEGFNADLIRDGKKVAEIINDASGGCLDFHWLDFAATRVDVNWTGYHNDPVVLHCTPQEAALYEFLRGKTWTLDLAGHDADNSPVQHDPESYASELVGKFLDDKRFRRMCKTQTLFRLMGDEVGAWRVIKAQYTLVLKERMQARYPTIVEVLNETYATADAVNELVDSLVPNS